MSTSEDDRWVSELLASLPTPEIPADISIRIEAALADEVAVVQTAPSQLAQTRRAGIRRWGIGALAVAAGIAAVLAVTLPTTRHSGSSSTSASRAAHAAGLNPLTLPAEVGRLLGPSADPGLKAAQPPAQNKAAPESGTAVTSGGASSSGATSGSVDSSRSPAAPQNAPADSLAFASAAPAEILCATVLSGADPSIVRAEEPIAWQGQPAYLIVIADPNGTGRLIDYVMSQSCAAGGFDILFQAVQPQ